MTSEDATPPWGGWRVTRHAAVCKARHGSFGQAHSWSVLVDANSSSGIACTAYRFAMSSVTWVTAVTQHPVTQHLQGSRTGGPACLHGCVLQASQTSGSTGQCASATQYASALRMHCHSTRDACPAFSRRLRARGAARHESRTARSSVPSAVRSHRKGGALRMRPHCVPTR